jgi:hypothetical protein
MVDELPLEEEMCKTPLYISAGVGMTQRHGFLDAGGDTYHHPGEKWVKCCKKKALNPEGDDQLICTNVEVLDQLKVHNDFNGWCGVHYCMNARDRCLKVGLKRETVEANLPADRGRCPSGCPSKCNKESFRFECIYTGKEPEFGTEGTPTPANAFGESAPYQVFSLAQVAAPSTLGLLFMSFRSAEHFGCSRKEVQNDMRTRRWSAFLSA